MGPWGPVDMGWPIGKYFYVTLTVLSPCKFLIYSLSQGYSVPKGSQYAFFESNRRSG